MKISFCADIHIGAPNTNLQELMGCFEQMISQSDMVVIGGDILDAKFQAASENITVLLDLFDYITPMISSTHKILRLIYGTQAHDGNPQLQILNPYTKRMNFRIIEHVEEEIINKTSFLYIPEEIILSKKDYYADTLYSGKKYDYIFGHGVIAEAMPMVRENTVKKMKSVPVFNSGDLSNACKYHSLFGHYHVNTEIGNVAYAGSITRFKHGEPDAKGWYLLDGKNRTFVENPWCPKYIEYKITAAQYTIEDLQSFITSKLNDFQSSRSDRDKIKFSVLMDRKSENALVYMDIIRTLCRGDGISYVIKDVNESVIQDDVVNDKYDYIVDQNVPIKDKILRYNEDEFDGELDLNLLDQYLSKTKVKDE